jgi:hypothetical protein
MSYTSNYNLNIRLSNLESKINGGGIPTSSNLADILLNGNSAGASDIDMNNNDILNCNNLQAVTINGNPIGGAQDIDQVLATGDTATGKQILLNATLPNTEFTLYKPDEIQVSDGVNTTAFFTPTTLDYNDGTAISATWEDIINTTNAPIIPTIQQVLTAGNNAQAPLTLGIQDSALSTATTIRGDIIEVEIDDGINPAQLVGLSYNSIGHNSGGSNLPFTIQTDGNLLLTSDNLNMSATALTIPAIGQPITAQLTQDGLTMIDTTNLWNSWYRKSSAFVSNLAGTIYTYITNTGVQLVDLTTNTTLTATGVTSGASSATWASIIAGSGGSGTLQSVLTAGNTATGASALIGLTNSGVGYTSNPQLTLNNSNATAGNTTGVPSVEIYKSGRNVVQNDIISSIFFYANNYLGTKRLFGKIESVITNSSGGGGDDGALDFYTCVNGTSSLVMRLNGADNENNSFRPLDMNGNAVRSSSGSMTIETQTSSGSGDLQLQSKGGGSFYGGTNLVLGAGNVGGSGIITLDASSVTSELRIVGTALQSLTAGGSSSTYLRIVVNGTPYKIQLLNDV